MTKKKVLSTKWFTNMYQELDRGTLYFGKCIVDTVLKGVASDKNIIDQELVEKVLFRSIVYRLINKVHNSMQNSRTSWGCTGPSSAQAGIVLYFN